MGCGFSCAPFFLSEAICAVFCPCCFLLADSEVFPHIDFNPSSAADVTALLTYIASQTGRIGVEAVAASDGSILWRHDREVFPVNGTQWRQSVWIAQAFTRPGFPIVVAPKFFRLDVDALGVGRL